eukprot:scaffold41144_cov71-Phaeocystis_antarctica.AAC.5
MAFVYPVELGLQRRNHLGMHIVVGFQMDSVVAGEANDGPRIALDPFVHARLRVAAAETHTALGARGGQVRVDFQVPRVTAFG